jgi:UDP-glucose 4-epimerase
MSGVVLRVAVVGASGFIGRSLTDALIARGHVVDEVVAPRLSTVARTVEDLRNDEARSLHAENLTRSFRDHDVVINAAGLSDATSRGEDELFGANSLLPLVIYDAARTTGVRRYIHISSAAVQGRKDVLDESTTLMPFSPYSLSKALAEQALAEQALTKQARGDRPGLCVYRPTSVHGADRPVTKSLVRVARSPLSSIAGAGDRPTPQVLVQDVANTIAWCAEYPEALPHVVLQPWAGMTTASVLHALSGRQPRRIPLVLARAVLGVLRVAAVLRPSWTAVARRVEMLWFGQAQERAWLIRHGLDEVANIESWRQLGDVVGSSGGRR